MTALQMTSCKPGDRRTSAPRDKEGSQDHKLKPKTAHLLQQIKTKAKPANSETQTTPGEHIKTGPAATQHQKPGIKKLICCISEEIETMTRTRTSSHKTKQAKKLVTSARKLVKIQQPGKKTAQIFAAAVIETQPTTSRTHKPRPTATQHHKTDQKQAEIFTTSKILVHETTCSHPETPGARPKQRPKHPETIKTARICQKKGMPYVSEILTFGNHSKTQFFFLKNLFAF